MKQTLKMCAPYFAVGVFWCLLSNAWLTILAYHVQILLWSRKSLSDMRWPARNLFMLLALPSALAGPLSYFLLPYIVHTDLSTWLASHHVSRLSLTMMIPCFGLLHPFLEQLHWAELRESTSLSHMFFAGYHMLVLYSLLTIPWLILCFVVLVTMSFMWQQMTIRSNSIAVAFASHVLADLGIIIAAWWRM